MILPDLPRVLNKKEASFTTIFNRWLKEKYKRTGVFEIKVTKTNTLPYSAVVDHQRRNLLTVRHNTFVFKIPDMGEKCPFDVVCYTQQPAYVVIKFKKGVCIIPIDTFLLAEQRSKRKSITYEEAVKLSTVSFA